ncbi:transcriptional regulator [Lysinibacillus sp. 2017]|uniref:MerR family transcriptional regulator n=1 Tax=unclassified Lysinibacillus TaxID=2636778 RepID=UPI000D5278F2|nr:MULTISPECIES: MerR family transcriptional regulator [unclassified Lysinibacillus]AWE08995.1 transcriptional regulator [Lysinibacillus sp. 2017]TGN35496.1 MerR family transcriptional regulator [Lysinibacillus sp. S2017]
MNPTSYSIQQVAEITGLSKQVIRKWEDRYQIIQPRRLDNGYRMYSEDEVQTLIGLTSLTNSGMTIKQAIEHYSKLKNSLEVNPVIHSRNALIQAGTEGNEQEILHLLEQALHKFGVEKLIEEIIIPFLHEVGQLWCENAWGEYQEAISSQTVRDFLSHIRRHFFVPEDAPLVLGSCLPGERHEIPMQILLIQCMLRGYQTSMLGPSPAPTAIQSTIALKKPIIVLLTGSTDIAFTEHAQSIFTLEKLAQAHRDISFFIGGAGSEKYYKQFQLNALKLSQSIHDIFPKENF